MKTRKYLTVLAYVTTVFVGNANATIEESFPLNLTKEERIELDRLACRTPHGVIAQRMEAWAFDRSSFADGKAEVHCSGHREFADSSIHYVVSCDRKENRWSCSEEQLEISVTVEDRKIAVRPRGVSIEVAHETIRQVGAAGWFQGQSLLEALQSPCYVSPGMAEELLDIACSGWGITVSLWCPERGCTHRVISLGRIFAKMPNNPLQATREDARV
jgi:hypothetical protein